MSRLLKLPLEGLVFIIRCAFEPFVTGPFLGLLLYTPAQNCDQFLEAAYLSYVIDPTQLIRGLRLLLAIGVASRINEVLNAWATNNWQVRAGHGWNWASEVAVVTGGCSGIGKATAQALTAHGIHVAVLDIQEAPEDIKANALITCFLCDLSSPEAIAETADKIRGDIGSPSILVNNAAISGSHTILKTPDAFLERIFSTNLLSHWRLVQHFVPDMVKKDKGHIFTVASVNSYLTNSANADYVATKTAALSFHEGLTSELKIWYRSPGVKTSIIHPAFVRTPLIEKTIIESGQDPKLLESMMGPDEVGDVIARQIIRRRGAQIFIPSYGAPISWLKALPNWTQELVRDAFGRTSAVTSGTIVVH